MNKQHLKQRCSVPGNSNSLALAHQLGAASIDERPEAEAEATGERPERAQASLQQVYEPRHYLATCAPIQFIPWAAGDRRKSCSWAPASQEPRCAQCVQRFSSAPGSCRCEAAGGRHSNLGWPALEQSATPRRPLASAGPIWPASGRAGRRTSTLLASTSGKHKDRVQGCPELKVAQTQQHQLTRPRTCRRHTLAR